MSTGSKRTALLIILTLLTGAAQPPGALAKQDEEANETSETRHGLVDFVQFFSNRTERAADQIARETDSLRIKRNTVYFKLRIMPPVRASLERADDQAVMMELWLYTVMLCRHFSSGRGDSLLGSGSSVMASACNEVEVAARSLASGLLSPEQFEAADRGIEKFVADRGDFFSLMGDPQSREDWSELVTTSLDKPLDVVSASISALPLGGGLSDTAVAVHHAAAEAERATTLLGYLPTDVRWQSQLLLLDVAEFLDLETLFGSIARVSESSVTISETVETLPTRIRGEVTTLLDEVDARQANLRSTLHDVNTVMVSADQTARTLTGASNAFTETLGALDKAMFTILGPPEERKEASKDGEESPPFDIEDYTETAVRLTETATALTALLVELRKIEESPAATAIAKSAGAVAKEIVTQVLVGAGLLVVFTALVALAYRAAAVKLGLLATGRSD